MDEVLTLTEAKRRAIVVALRAARGNMCEAADLLLIGRTTLYRKVVELEIQPAEWGGKGAGSTRPRLVAPPPFAQPHGGALCANLGQTLR